MSGINTSNYIYWNGTTWAVGDTNVTIGANAGKHSQGNYAVAIGNAAGSTGQGDYAIAMGYYAAQYNQSANSIVINASSSKTVNAGTTGFFVNPIRSGTGGIIGGDSGADYTLSYDTNTSEITYSTTVKAFNLFLTGATGQTGGVDNSSNTNNNVYCNNVYALSAVYANNVALTSDYRIKENVKPLDNKFHVDYLKPVSYTNKQTNEEDIGFIAHELQEHYPELVSGVKDGSELQRVNYIGLIPILVNEIKALKNNNIMLENEINNIKEFLKQFT